MNNPLDRHITLNMWETKTLGDITKVLTDYTANGSFESLKNNVTYYTEENFAALIRTTDLEQTPFIPARFTDKKGYLFQKKTALFGGEIVLANVGSVGKVYIVPEYHLPMTLAPNTYLVEFSSDVDKDFVYQFLKSDFYIKGLYRTINTTTLAAINKDNFRSIPIKLPCSKTEQKAISRILKKVDETIEKTKALIQKHQQIKQGLMHGLFTRGVTPDGKLRPAKEQAPKLYKETPIGWIPREWDAKKLGEILRIFGGYIQTGPFGSQLHAHEYSYEGVPVIMPQDINDGKIDTDNIAKIPIKRAQTLNRHKVEAGDIIIARRGELSRAAAITSSEKNWVCGTGCFLLRLGRDELNSHFFSYAYRHHIVQRQIAGLAVGSTMPNLNNTIMNKLYFPLLEKDEQQRIVQRLFHIESHLNSLVDKSRKLKKQKLGLMQDLLTGKVRVKVD